MLEYLEIHKIFISDVQMDDIVDMIFHIHNLYLEEINPTTT